MNRSLGLALTVCAVVVSSPGDRPAVAQAVASNLVYTTVQPCRLIDTRTGRGFSGNYGPPNLIHYTPPAAPVGTQVRTFVVASDTGSDFTGQPSPCHVPTTAKAVTVGVTAAVIPGSTQGFVTMYPTALPPTVGATVVFAPSINIETSAIVALGAGGNFDVIAGFSDIGLVVDLTGYFVPEVGDISGVTVSPPLSGGGTSGDVPVSLSGCGTDGQILKWSSGSWQCASEAAGGGGVTSITAGTGLTGGTITTTGSIAVDFGTTASKVAAGNHDHLGGSWSGSATPGLHVASTGANGIGLEGETNQAGGAGVSAKGSGTTGTALRIDSGAIQVPGAGVNSSTSFFIHKVTDTTFGFSILSHPLLGNGSGNVLLFVTSGYESQGCTVDTLPVKVTFVPGSGPLPDAWELQRVNGSAPPIGACYLMIVVKP